jgi:hypothetical protein
VLSQTFYVIKQENREKLLKMDHPNVLEERLILANVAKRDILWEKP